MEHADGATKTTRAFVTGETRYSSLQPRQSRHFRLDQAKLLVVYAGAGSLGTAAHFAVLYAALAVMGAVAASTLGAILGCLVNFSLSRHIVFHDRQPLRRTLPRFAAVATFAVALNAAMLKALIAGLPLFPSQVLSTMVVFLFTFVFNKGWTFGERHQ